MARPVPRIRATSLKGIDGLMAALGCDATSCLAEFGVDVAQTRNPGVRISYFAYADILRRCAELTGREDFALRLAASDDHDADVVGPFQVLGRTARRIGDAIEPYIRYYSLQSEGAVYWLESDGATAVVRREGRIARLRHERLLEDLSMAEWYRLMGVLCGEAWRAEVVYFTHPRPENVRPYRRIFDCPLMFEQEMNGISFDAALLEHKIAGADRARFDRAVDGLRAALQKEARPLADSVRDTVIATLSSGELSEGTIAGLFNVHPRTLHRRLSRESTSLRQIVSETRRELATTYLAHTRLPVGHVSALLGYSETAAFTRAFRRWTGTSPLKWRIAS